MEEAAAGLTEEQVADLKEAFAMFDINGDGMLLIVCDLVSSLLPSECRRLVLFTTRENNIGAVYARGVYASCRVVRVLWRRRFQYCAFRPWQR